MNEILKNPVELQSQQSSENNAVDNLVNGSVNQVNVPQWQLPFVNPQIDREEVPVPQVPKTEWTWPYIAPEISSEDLSDDDDSEFQPCDEDKPIDDNGVEQNSSTSKESVGRENKYAPKYSLEETKLLQYVTTITENEIVRVSEDETYFGTKFGENCIVNLKRAYWEGKKDFGTPVFNRCHGKDKEKTGNSLLSHGAQHPLIIMTKKMCDTAGIETTRFSSDKNQEPLPDDALIFADGNGRGSFLLSQPLEVWPDIYGVFPSKDASGFYNFARAIEVINTELSVWKTENFVQKIIASEGSGAHEGWKMINQLVKDGYKYQAACELVALSIDRIKKSAINQGNDKDIFRHFESAKKVFKALKNKFGEDGTTLKTKIFPMKVSELWRILQQKYGDDKATELFVSFINLIDDKKVTEIKEAKSEKGGISRDTKRQTILEEAFNAFFAAEMKDNN